MPVLFRNSLEKNILITNNHDIIIECTHGTKNAFSLSRALAQLKAAAFLVSDWSLELLQRHACSNLLHFKTNSEGQSKNINLASAIKSYVLDDIRSATPTSNLQINASSLHVAILLCTHQGQIFLKEQLDSFLNQTHTNWRIWASDDSSDDQTKKILQQFQKTNGIEKLSLIEGPNIGFL